MRQFRIFFLLSVFLGLVIAIPTVGLAAPRQQGTNAETTCEVVSVGQYYCKINDKCYYCDTKTNPDPNKNCRETKCDKALTRPGIKGTMRPPSGGVLRRGVEGEQPEAGIANPSGTLPETK